MPAIRSPLRPAIRAPLRSPLAPALGGSPSLTAQVQALFASRAGGMWDFGDTSTLFQDAAGTVPVTTTGQTMAAAIDISKGLSQGATILTNGDFSVGGGWTLASGASYAASLLRCSAAEGYTYQNATAVTAGALYRVRYTVSNYVSGTVRAYMNASPVFGPTISANGVVEHYLISGSANLETGLNFSAFTGDIDDFSIRLVTSNVATQATAGSRPLFSARKNMLTKSEQFNDGVWVNSLIAVSTDSATAPDGSVTAEKLCPTVVSGVHVMVQNAFTVGTGVAVLSVYAKAAEYTRVGLRESATTGAWAVFDLSGGTVLGSGDGTSSTSIASVGNGWYRCSMTVSAASAGIAVHVVGAGWTSYSPNWNSYTGNGTDGIYAWGAQLEQVALSRYQRVNTASDYDTVGFPAFAQFDATDDALLFPAITFGGAFNTFVAGKLTGGTNGVHLWRTADPSFGYWAAYQSASGTPPEASGVGTPSYTVNGVALSPSTRGELYSRINGVDSVVETTGIVLTAETAIQFSGYPAVQFQGNLHRILMISGTLTAAEKLLCRQWAAQGNGVTVV